MTNATKAAIITLVNAAFGLAVVFDVAITEAQKGAIIVFVNAGLGLFVGLTYKNSAKRQPDA